MMTVRGTMGNAVLVIGLGLAIAWGGTAQAQQTDLQSLLARIDRMERDIRTLNIQIARGGSAAPTDVAAAPMPTGGGMDMEGGPALARLGVRITALEQEVRSATGQMESLSHRIQDLSQRLEKMSSDIEYRFGALQAAGAGLATETPPSSAPSASPPAAPAKPRTLGTLSGSEIEELPPPSPSPSPSAAPATVPEPASAEPPANGSPKELYDHAFALLRQTRYDDAEASLKRFLEEYPDDALAPNARYWLGETHYVRGDYATAAAVFLDGYKRTPNGPKAADTLLKLGMALGNLDKKKEACATFGKLLKEFPKMSPALRSTTDRERKKVGCS